MTTSNTLGNVVYMGAAKKKLRPTEVQLEAERLAAFWNVKKSRLGITQDDAAEAMDISQTMVSQYLRGTKVMGDTALLRFCIYLDAQPTAIRPNYEFANLMPGDLTPSQVEVARLWKSLPIKLRETWKAQLKETLQSLGPRKTE